MGKGTKATKKFEKNRLKGVLERRKATAKIKQRNQIKDKKKTKRAKDAEFYTGVDGGTGASKADGKKRPAVADMSVDEFFQGGFEILHQDEGKKASKKLGKRKRDDPEHDELLFGSDGPEAPPEDSPASPAVSDRGSGSDSEGERDDNDEADVGMSKQALDDLAKTDPEFYKFLQENDPEALEFDDDADLAEVDALSGSDEDEEPPKKKQKKSKKGRQGGDSGDEVADDNELTDSQVARWKKGLETRSLRAAKEVVLAFRCAAHLNEVDEDSPQRYAINSPQVYHDILILALKEIPLVFQHHVPVKESASGKVHFQAEGKKFRALSNMLKSYVSSIVHLLGILSDDGTLKVTISAITPLIPYLLSFRKLLKALIKTVVSFWSRYASSDSTRITAFLVLRRLVVVGDKGVRETVLKAVHEGLIQGCRTTNTNTIKGINLMKNSAAELWGIDQAVGYTTAFSLIKQAAIHLRNSIVKNKNESYKNVYNWQYVHSLDFWSTVLSEHCNLLREAEAGKGSQLRPLIYPLVQVTIGAMRLIPSSTYFPLRFLLVRSLLRISRSTGTFIPMAPFLLEVLNSAEMKKPATNTSKVQPLDFSVSYKTPASYLKTRVYQDNIGEQVVELLSEFFVLWCKNIAFPELSLPVIIMIKRWMKETRRKSYSNNHKVLSGLTILVQKLEANGKFIEERRANVDFAPKDRTQVNAFLKDLGWDKTPLGAYVSAQRTVREERAKDVERAREEEKKRKARVEKETKAAQKDSFAEFEDDEHMDGADSYDESDDEAKELGVDSEEGDEPPWSESE